MAQSPSHKFGQIVGDLLEEIVEPLLQAFCDQRGLYLDKDGPRGAARKGKRVEWEDKFGNCHHLDFVIEKGGTSQVLGRPLAFIEAAWRRYTKHSRNKVQEIQGAILPIVEKHEWDKPFVGAILAGVFTQDALVQMRSSGFEVMLFPYETITAAFATVGIDVEFDETTPDNTFKKTIQSIEALNPTKRSSLKKRLIQSNQRLIDGFVQKLAATLDRKIERVILIPLHGEECRFEGISDAIDFVNAYQETRSKSGVFRKYEVVVGYTNGDRIDASFTEKAEAIRFLKYLGEG